MADSRLEAPSLDPGGYVEPGLAHGARDAVSSRRHSLVAVLAQGGTASSGSFTLRELSLRRRRDRAGAGARPELEAAVA